MERVKGLLGLSKDESELVSKIVAPPHRPHVEPSFYDEVAFRGIRVDRVEPGLVVCSYRVPPRVADKSGNMAAGAIANIMDVVGATPIHEKGKPVGKTVNISISYLSTAKVDDELEVTSKVLGKKGSSIAGTVVSVKNKVTGETIAEGRIMFTGFASKI